MAAGAEEVQVNAENFQYRLGDRSLNWPGINLLIQEPSDHEPDVERIRAILDRFISIAQEDDDSEIHLFRLIEKYADWKQHSASLYYDRRSSFDSRSSSEGAAVDRTDGDRSGREDYDDVDFSGDDGADSSGSDDEGDFEGAAVVRTPRTTFPTHQARGPFMRARLEVVPEEGSGEEPSEEAP